MSKRTKRSVRVEAWSTKSGRPKVVLTVRGKDGKFAGSTASL